MYKKFFVTTFIFLISLTQYSCVSNNKSKRITKSIGIDTEPEWSDDGKFIFFT